MKKSLLFKQFLKNPNKIGSLYPSSSALCRAMISGIDIESAAHVVELGPGTGVITLEILTSVNHQTNFIAIELDTHIYDAFKKHWPFVKIYNDSAGNLSAILEQEKISHVDAIVSGLPWAAFPDSLQIQILEEVIKNLSPGGYFTTFAYVQGMLLPAARRFRKLLKRSFSCVETSPIVWNNIPPAFVYRCRK
ncbi:MAG: rRNA adenine N-6-methyltransferase family protein [Victivallaceae bacterium]